ncbi:MAG: type II toxin-antitoxin system RelE/ParE family toxin [Oscillospiraceae bacterium]|nr:type II toxin-antitoxin system RelE/ParE family toxin [Oscillospiraceae bacterium]
MKYKVLYLPLARRDILGVSEALSAYQSRAKRLFGEMESKLRLLEFMPQMWPEYGPASEYRRMDLEGYLLLYTVDENRREARVCRVLSDRVDAGEQPNRAKSKVEPSLRVVDTPPALEIIEAEAEGE